MERLRRAGLAEPLQRLTCPVLGICLGMQLLFSASEEGATTTLGVLPGMVTRIKAVPGRPVPHMGWNQLEGYREDPILEGIASREYVYFVHSFGAPAGEHTVAAVDYGIWLSAIVRRDNFWGTQFHPERSGKVGARLLGNFLRL
jgi:glutamine amidotransferase